MNTPLYLKFFLTATLGFGLLHAGSLAAFLYAPESFYYRPWEFFGEVGYRVKDIPIRWQGPVLQDQTRKNFFYYQNSHVVEMTADDDGFRARRFEADKYPVMVSGDSTIFGSGLSDDETLPWLLAERTNLPVFNAGRAGLANALAHPSLRNTEVVIDGWTERNIYPRLLAKATIRLQDPFLPFAPRDKTFLEAVKDIPPGRYSLPLIAVRTARRMFRDIEVFATGGEQQYTFIRHRMRPEDMERTVSLIAERSRTIEGLGKRYVFLPVPAKQTLYAGDVDEYTRNFVPVLVARLRAEGIEAVDLVTPFQAAKDDGLYFPFDTHWNARGTEIAARIVAREVFAK